MQGRSKAKNYRGTAAGGWGGGGGGGGGWLLVGTCTVRGARSEHALPLGGSGGMPPPQENFEK